MADHLSPTASTRACKIVIYLHVTLKMSVHRHNSIMSIIYFVGIYMHVYSYVHLVTFERLLHLYDIYSIIFIQIGMQMVNSC